MKNSIIFTLLLVVSTVSSPSWALGKLGHQLVCELSYQLLNKEQQEQIDLILNRLPKNDKQAINSYLKQAKNKPISFADSCVWADAIKRHDEYKQYKSWHYVNVGRDEKVLDSSSCAKNCVTRAIEHHQKALASKSNDLEQAYALMFLGHWVGDIHQPLHVSFASDLGGNKVSVIPAVGRCRNLHWYWDECLLYSLNKKTKTAPKNDYALFKQQLYLELQHKLNKAPQQEWRDSSIEDWANESLALVRSASFNYCELDNTVCLSKSNDTIRIDEAYHQQFQPILHMRILQAAVRLTQQIEESLK